MSESGGTSTGGYVDHDAVIDKASAAFRGLAGAFMRLWSDERELDPEWARFFDESASHCRKLLDGVERYRALAIIENLPEIRGFIALRNAISSVMLSPEMANAPQARRIALMMVEAIESHSVLNHREDAVFSGITNPILKNSISERARKAGRGSKKPNEKERALIYWAQWADGKLECKNLSGFISHLKKYGCCSTDKTARSWVAEFRATCPSEKLESILPGVRIG